MHGRLLREHTLHEVSIRLWLQGDVEHTLVPALHRPSHTLAEIVDGTPISQTDHLVPIHLIEVRSHRSRTCLTLIEGLLWITLHIAREVHIAIVVGVDLRSHRQVGRNVVGLQIAIARVHRHGRETSIIITMKQFLLKFVCRHAPVVERQVGILLQLIAQAPEHDRRMVAVTSHPLWDVLLPKAFPLHLSTGILGEPLVIKFIDHQDTKTVAELEEVLAIRVMRSTHMVHAELLHQLQSFLDGTWISRSTECSQGMMVGIALQQYLLAIDEQALAWRIFDGAHTKLLLDLVSHIALMIIERHLCRI